MNDLPPPGTPPFSQRTPGDRLDSWKEIAAYMKRDVTTVQRWEKREGMPVHRHVHDKMGSVYAFRTDLDAWAQSRNLGLIAENVQRASRSKMASAPAIRAAPRWWLGLWVMAATGAILAAALLVWQIRQPHRRVGESAGGCPFSAAD